MPLDRHRRADARAKLTVMEAPIACTLTEAEMQELRDRCKEEAADGRYELYKVSLKFDNPEARLAHDFPLDTEQSEVQDMLGAQQNTGHPFPEKKF